MKRKRERVGGWEENHPRIMPCYTPRIQYVLQGNGRRRGGVVDIERGGA